MPIEILLPDGGRAQFPDGMSDAEITAVLSREFPAPPQEMGIPFSPAGAALASRPDTTVPDASRAPLDTQGFADFLGQTAGTGLGIAGGTALGGVPGAIAGGAAGSAGGKALSRFLTGAPQPAPAELATDAALGAAGPAAGAVAGTARPFMRAILGGKPNVERVAEAGRNASILAHEAKQSAAALRAGPDLRKIGWRDIDEVLRTSMDAEVAQSAVAKAYTRAVREATKGAELISPQNINTIGVAAAMLAEPLTAIGAFLGGHAIRTGHKRLAENLLGSPRFIEWALSKGPTFKTKGQIAASLGTLAASKGLPAHEREDVLALRDALAEGRAKPGRDPRTGQFRRAHRQAQEAFEHGAVLPSEEDEP